MGYAAVQEARVSEEQSEREDATPDPVPVGCDITYHLRKIPARRPLILAYVRDVTRIVITREVQGEIVEAGLAGGYPDTVAIKERMTQDGSKYAPSPADLPDLKSFSTSIAYRKEIKQWYAWP